MDLFKHIYSETDYSKIIKETSEIRIIINELEHYIFSLYDKLNVYAEIKNKYYDIVNSSRGYIKNEETNFIKNGQIINNNKFLFYFKGWTNRRLKRILNIINLELRFDGTIYNKTGDVINCISKIEEEIKKNEFRDDYETSQILLKIISSLKINLEKQKKILKLIYPIKDWSLENHENLFTKEFDDLIKNEICTIFGFNSIENNYNDYPGLVSKQIHDSKIPSITCLGKLISKHMYYVKEHRQQEKISHWITAYHVYPIYAKGKIFPLDIKLKNTGFFVDLNLDETKDIIKNIYDVKDTELEIYKLEIPINLFKLFILDTNDVTVLKDVELENSYVLKPTDFPKFNEYYRKGLIKITKIN